MNGERLHSISSHGHIGWGLLLILLCIVSLPIVLVANDDTKREVTDEELVLRLEKPPVLEPNIVKPDPSELDQNETIRPIRKRRPKQIHWATSTIKNIRVAVPENEDGAIVGYQFFEKSRKAKNADIRNQWGNDLYLQEE